MKVLNRLLSLIFPVKQDCVICGCKANKYRVCYRCLQKIKELRGLLLCECCGRYVTVQPGEDKNTLVCRECRESQPAFFRARSVGPYREVLKDAIYKFKYQKYRSLADSFGLLMAEVFVKEPGFANADMLLPIPLSREKIISRGFNQSELLAYKTAELLKIPVGNCLRRIVDTPSLSKLGRKARSEKITGVFRVDGPVLKKKIILIDDIFTTGATAGECAVSLLRDGASSVGVLTIASGIQEKNK